MNYFYTGKNIMDMLRTKEKERADLILEPMQVMIQLALLAHSPIGTKISVSNNILTIQPPTSMQGVVRWWNNDNKDDLYYLFHAIRRYYKWYKSQDDAVYQYILIWAIKGIDKLSETYNKADKNNIRHTLALYKNVLDLKADEIFKDDAESTVNIDSVFQEIVNIYDDKLLYVVHNSLLMMEEEQNTEHVDNYLNGLILILEPMNIKIRKWIMEKLAC
jgi:hypothetical protein|tara:strand:+ start:1368 stop:2021 length:654 start_codon:yes stop_codon:yes gene_type:complete